MPATLRRSYIAHTPDIIRALEVGASRWPQDAHKPEVLLARLAVEGARSVGNATGHASGLMVLPATGFTLTTQAIEDAFNDTY